jgi:hypothetical protein
MREGVPADAEAKMIAKCGLRGDSPAKKAQKNLQVPMKEASKKRGVMNWDEMSARWMQLKGSAKQKWSKFTDDDLDYVA